jgi:hypothetical protein
MASGFEDARVLPHSFLTAVSGHHRECGIDIPDFPVGIGYDDAIRGLLHSRNQTGAFDIVTFPAHFSPRLFLSGTR